MAELIQHYLENRSKLFALFIELLHSFTLLFFACQLYGLELNFDDLIIEAKSVSANFFLTFIGVGLTYLTIAYAAQLIIAITSSIVLRVTDWIGYQEDRTIQKDNKKSFLTFKQFRKNKEIGNNEGAQKFFSGLNEKEFIRFKDFHLEKKATRNFGRIFIILLAYLIIRLTFKEEDFSILVNWIIGIGLLIFILLYNKAVEFENALAAPGFFKKVEERRRIRDVRKIINDNKHCTKLKIDNLFFISNRKKKTIGWIIIIDGDWNNGSHLEELLKTDSIEKGIYKILIDVLDFIPDKFMNEENLKIIKSIDTFNLTKEVNAILIADRNKNMATEDFPEY